MVEKRIKSKYEGYGVVTIKETVESHDYVAVIENNSNRTLKLYVDDLEGWYSDPITVEPHNKHGLLRDDEGRDILEFINNGDFKAVLETPTDLSVGVRQSDLLANLGLDKPTKKETYYRTMAQQTINAYMDGNTMSHDEMLDDLHMSDEDFSNVMGYSLKEDDEV